MLEKLQVLLDSGRVPHALVIDGGTYEDRLSEARALAAALIKDTDKVMADIHPDVITILPEEKKKTISVDIIRKMREDAYIIPNENEHKIYIIAKAELMQDYAQNALLKILEEPPKYATFILLCSTRSVLLNTVLSRVALFSLSDDDTLESSDNFNECLDISKNIASALAKKDDFEILSVTSYFDKNFDNLPLTLDCLQGIIRDALALQNDGPTITQATKEAEALSKSLTATELFKIQDGIIDIGKAINIYSNKNLTLTRLVSKLTGGHND